MNKRYLCNRHKERTPSVVVYPDHAFCYGCRVTIPHSELGLAPNEKPEITYVEDIPNTIEYILSLPKRNIRGFDLNFDNRGYYLLWPDKSYYKCRISGVESGSKYRGPSGHKKPPFKVTTHKPALMLVEGELNALSASLVVADMSIISPGGAGDFYSVSGKRLLQECCQFSTIDLVVDSDAAGVKAAIESKSYLIGQGCSNVKIHLVEEDFNDVLTRCGSEGLRERIAGMGMQGARL